MLIQVKCINDLSKLILFRCFYYQGAPFPSFHSLLFLCIIMSLYSSTLISTLPLYQFQFTRTAPRHTPPRQRSPRRSGTAALYLLLSIHPCVSFFPSPSSPCFLSISFIFAPLSCIPHTAEAKITMEVWQRDLVCLFSFHLSLLASFISLFLWPCTPAPRHRGQRSPRKSGSATLYLQLAIDSVHSSSEKIV